MRKKNFKGRSGRRMTGKCAEVCRTYDAIQYTYADLLQASDEAADRQASGCRNGSYTGKVVIYPNQAVLGNRNPVVIHQLP